MERVTKIIKTLVPNEVKLVVGELQAHNYKPYIVGGCVRDVLRGVEPQDWDVAVRAKPEDISGIFKKSFANNKFGTVTVLIPKSKSGSVLSFSRQDKIRKTEFMEIEITPFRLEAKYTDKRHPDKIKWAETIEEDLGRRDFTVNAMALALDEKSRIQNQKSQTNSKSKILKSKQYKLIDPFGGQKDLEAKIIRAAGNPEERFSEDALRLIRAVRFAVTLGEGWKIEPETKQAIKKTCFWLQAISKERVRDEFLKIIMSEKAAEGVELLRKSGLLKYVMPELEQGCKISQNKHHIYDCYEHSLLSLKYSAEKKFNRYVRLASLLHDIAKPETKKGEGPEATFYGHEVAGAKMTAQILNRLKFPRKDIEKIAKLVRYHLFYYNVDEVTESSVRRLVRNVGPEHITELLQVRMADRIGSGVPKAEPYKLRHLKYVIEKVSKDPVSVKMLKLSGDDVMRILDIKPGPKVGQVLDVLLGYVLESPEKNQKELLEKEVENIGKLQEQELQKLAQKSRQERNQISVKRDEMTKQKYWVT